MLFYVVVMLVLYVMWWMEILMEYTRVILESFGERNVKWPITMYAV